MICHVCKGLRTEPGKAYGYAGPICTCSWTCLGQEKYKWGWICPICDKVHSPDSKECNCKK